MSMEYLYILYFLAGILQDFLFTSSLRLVNQDLPLKASPVAFLDNLVSVGVLYILTKLDNDRSIVAIHCLFSRCGDRYLYCHEIKNFEK